MIEKVDLFAAGVTTVSTTLEWILLLPANEPHYQTRARVDAVTGGEIADTLDTSTTQASYVNALRNSAIQTTTPICHVYQTLLHVLLRAS